MPAGYVVAPPLAAYPHLYQPQPVTQPQHHQFGHSPTGAPPPLASAGGGVGDTTRVVYSQQQQVHPQTPVQASPSALASSGVVARPLEVITEITQELRRDSVESSAGTRSEHKPTSLPDQ